MHNLQKWWYSCIIKINHRSTHMHSHIRTIIKDISNITSSIRINNTTIQHSKIYKCLGMPKQFYKKRTKMTTKNRKNNKK